MYSPAATSICPGARSRIKRSPGRSSEVTGSSNQRMSASATSLREVERLLDGECAIGVDKKLAVADRRFGLPHPIRIALRLTADLHLDEAAAVALDPAGKLLAQLLRPNSW